MNGMKRQKDMTSEGEPSRSEGLQYITGKELSAITKNSQKMKQLSQSRNDLSVDVSGSKSNKEQYSIGTWNLKSVNQGKLDMVKQEMARVNVNILGISE